MNVFQSLKPTTLVILLALCACSPKVDMRGYSTDADWNTLVVPGKTTKDEVMSNFGSPSSQSNFGDETWYYISEHKEAYLFFDSKIVDQHVVRIQYDQAGIVTAMDNYNKGDAKDFSIASRTTPTEGHTLGFFEQLLGNIGRFNKPSNGSDTNAPGRKPSP